jgi:hypothetical protein
MRPTSRAGGTAGLAGRPTFLEVFYPFERDDVSILEAVKRSVALLKPAFSRGPIG